MIVVKRRRQGSDWIEREADWIEYTPLTSTLERNLMTATYPMDYGIELDLTVDIWGDSVQIKRKSGTDETIFKKPAEGIQAAPFAEYADKLVQFQYDLETKKIKISTQSADGEVTERELNGTANSANT